VGGGKEKEKPLHHGYCQKKGTTPPYLIAVYECGKGISWETGEGKKKEEFFARSSSLEKEER